jgi:LysR family glycine cleavage system transcriptional activator
VTAAFKSPSLRLLRAFCLAARHSSFKLAADRLGLTPSAVSHQVKELEDSLGVVLFERRTRAVELTPAGRQLLDDLEPALEALQAAIARTVRAARRRQLSVVMPPFFASELCAPRLPDFYHQHDDVDLKIDTRDPRPRQHVPYSDLTVVLATQQPVEASQRAMRLLPLQFVAVASPRVAAAVERARAVDPSRAFDGQTLILHRSFRNDIWERWLSAIAVDLGRIRNVVEFDNLVAVARAAERDGGIALLPLEGSQPWFDSGALMRIEGLGRADDDAYYLVGREEDFARPEVRAFSGWLLEQFAPGTATPGSGALSEISVSVV